MPPPTGSDMRLGPLRHRCLHPDPGGLTGYAYRIPARPLSISPIQFVTRVGAGRSESILWPSPCRWELFAPGLPSPSPPIGSLEPRGLRGSSRLSLEWALCRGLSGLTEALGLVGFAIPVQSISMGMCLMGFMAPVLISRCSILTYKCAARAGGGTYSALPLLVGVESDRYIDAAIPRWTKCFAGLGACIHLQYEVYASIP